MDHLDIGGDAEMKATRTCPVCWQSTLPTTRRTVFRHWDSVGRDICPMSGQPYDFVQAGRRVVPLELVSA